MTYILVVASFLLPLGIILPDEKTEDDIKEAVFRYMFDHEARQQKPYAKYYFIGIGKVGEGDDPSQDFMKRFEENIPIVKRMSQSTVSSSGIVVDKETSDGGIRFSVSGIRWIKENQAEVEAGYYVAGLFAGGCEYGVVLEDGKWVVKGCAGKRWIS